MSYSKKNLFKALGVFVFVLITSVMVIWFGFLNLVEKNKSEYENSRVELLQLEKRAELRNELKREFNRTSVEAEEIKGAFLAPGDTLVLIKEIESLAFATQAEYQIRVAQEIRDSATGELLAINFNVELSGTYNGLLRFLRGMKQDQPYFTQITSITISRIETDLLKTTAIIKVLME